MRKILSILVICLTALGIITSLVALVEVWHFRLPITRKLQSYVDQFSSVLQITDDGLVVIDQVVSNIYSSTDYLNDATEAFSHTVQSTSQFMETAGDFVGNNLVTTLTNTQTALTSAQASAKVIDNILSTLSKVPLIGISYDPAVPLNIALGNVSTSLDPLQVNLKNFQTDLTSTRSDMHEFSSQISALNENIQNIQVNLYQAQVTISQYRSQLRIAQTVLLDIKTNLPSWMKTTAWIMTIIIVWLVLIQISLLFQTILLANTNQLSPQLVQKPDEPNLN
jgi:ABC-type transporter Mla subunit MlaD